MRGGPILRRPSPKVAIAARLAAGLLYEDPRGPRALSNRPRFRRSGRQTNRTRAHAHAFSKSHQSSYKRPSRFRRRPGSRVRRYVEEEASPGIGAPRANSAPEGRPRGVPRVPRNKKYRVGRPSELCAKFNPRVHTVPYRPELEWTTGCRMWYVLFIVLRQSTGVISLRVRLLLCRE